MYDFIAGLVTGWLFTWPGLVILAVLGVIFEHTDWRGFAVLALGIVGAGLYYTFKPDLAVAAMYAGGYLAIGLVWSVWRYKRAVDAFVEKCKEYESHKQYAYKLKPTEMWPTITAWVIVWPFSAVENLLADVIDAIERIIQTVFRGVFVKIYKSAMDKINVDY